MVKETASKPSEKKVEDETNVTENLSDSEKNNLSVKMNVTKHQFHLIVTNVSLKGSLKRGLNNTHKLNTS